MAKLSVPKTGLVDTRPCCVSIEGPKFMISRAKTELRQNQQLKINEILVEPKGQVSKLNKNTREIMKN